MAAKWRCRLFWGNPYTVPPHNMPRILKAVICDHPRTIPHEIEQMIAPGTECAPGSGWTIGWECIEQRPIRRWSVEAKARVRRLRLRRRLEKKFPLFAEDFIAAELSRRPQYFAGQDG
ncbi:hypothetical protein [Rhodovulum sp. P5]|uniref:hypothetical protein n=1 Tax=Rhodovulum phage vB_RhkS_P1 TaxID=1873452 RepID=UPI00080ABDDE|nr:hypothetical protein [Rhodovulum sp. P5]YP_009285915.1 hypothetical protein BI026_gp30 [Rhodovulum phage vB_RhkS_P1]ANT39901.1 hypothetical protein Rhks_30 [Rhodovulum phage vB_RhkS_P1]